MTYKSHIDISTREFTHPKHDRASKSMKKVAEAKMSGAWSFTVIRKIATALIYFWFECII